MNSIDSGLGYPKMRWPSAGSLVAPVVIIIAIVDFILPSVTKLSSICLAGITFGLFVLIVIYIAAGHCLQMVSILFRRAAQYEHLLVNISSQQNELDEAKAQIISLVEDKLRQSGYPIDYCYDYGGRTYIELKKKRGPELPAGTSVIVVDMMANAIMGYFTTRSVSDGHYICELTGSMDALWLGNIKQSGSVPSKPPPEAIAVLIANQSGDQDE